jgi:hypothetical protein
MKPGGGRICMAKYARSCFNETCSFFGQNDCPGNELFIGRILATRTETNMFQSPWTCLLVAFDVPVEFLLLIFSVSFAFNNGCKV